MDKITIRKARLTDIPLLARLEAEFDRDEGPTVLKENPKVKPYLRADSTVRFKSQRMLKWLASRNSLVLIAEADSVPCGFSVQWVGTQTLPYRPPRFGYIGIMFVQRSYRGRGISSMMMKEAQGWFAKRNVGHIMLTVLTYNKQARAIYEKWGFVDFVTTMWKTL
jgi:ribosomal protein S18 acetylase RimI-like enzyme